MAGARVLVVEDESLLAETLCDLMQAAGCEPVGPAATVAAALRLIDQALLERRAVSIGVVVRPANAQGPTTPVEITLHPEGERLDGEPSGLFTTTWVPPDVGKYILEPSDPLLTGLDLAANLDVAAPDDELRTPQADHAFLASLALATGGRVLLPSELSQLPTLLPNREVTLLGTPETETLWDKPAVWVLLMLLVATEWMGRRLIKLA